MGGNLGTTEGEMLKLASLGFASSNHASIGIEALRIVDGTDWTSSAIGFKFDVDDISPVNNCGLWLNANGNIGVGTPTPTSKLYSTINNQTIFGMHAHNIHETGTGIMGTGSDVTAVRYSNGSGVAGVGLSCGVFGYADTNAVVGIGTDFSYGTGVYGEGDYTGLFGFSTWIGVLGYTQADNAKAGYFYSASTSDSLTGLFSIIAGNATGLGYGFNVVNSAVKGYTAFGNNYNFGISGYRNDDTNRSGGVIGGSNTNDTPTAWASLGYKNSANNQYGMYATSTRSGSGFYSESNKVNGVAIGSYADLLGIWTKGELMGMLVKGDLFAQYNMGNVYTSGTQIDIVTTESGRKPAYAVTATEMKVYDNGFATLTSTETFVPFEESFSSLLNNDRPNVTLTPIGQAVQLYIKSISKKGFTIVAKDFTEAVELSWIAVGKRTDSDINARIPEDILDASFDEKLDAFMFNESILERNAGNMWWDGSKLRFDKISEEKEIIHKPIKEEHILINGREVIKPQSKRNLILK